MIFFWMAVFVGVVYAFASWLGSETSAEWIGSGITGFVVSFILMWALHGMIKGI